MSAAAVSHPVNGNDITELRLALRRNGYLPVPVVTGQKWPALKAWQRVCSAADDTEVRRWSHALPGSQSTGLLCGAELPTGALVGVDIDVLVPELAEAVEAIAVQMLGPTPLRRVGRAPKLLLCYRTGETFAKMQTAEVALGEGGKCRVEILARGQQFVGYGTHPNTGQPYRWTDHDPVTVPIRELPPVDRASAAAFIGAAGKLIEQGHGKAASEKMTDSRGVTNRPRRAPRETPGVAIVGEALAAIPNDDMPYDDWINIGFALSSWDAGDAGLALWRDFSARSAKNNPAVTIAKWPSFSPARTLTIEYVFRLARHHGWRGGPRPLVRLSVEDLPDNVDQAEAALLTAEVGLYQRGGQVVRAVRLPLAASSSQWLNPTKIVEASSHHVVEAMMRAADFEKFDARSDGWVPAECPIKVADTYLARRKWALPVLTGVVNCPTLRPDGTVLDQPGYDAATGFVFDPQGAEFRPIDSTPTATQARAALDALRALISTFPFVTSADRSVALSAILTAVVRPALDTAPLHAFTAPAAGSGKSLLVDVAGMIAAGRPVPVIAQGKTEEEMEKRLGAALMAGDVIISIDNCEAPLGGELLCQMLTQRAVKVRVLGKSLNFEGPPNCTMFATGNNLRIEGDMTRRALLCSLDAETERPELRQFSTDPLATARMWRSALVPVVLTIVRAYVVAGCPGAPPQLGSFEQWSRWVRGALIWLGETDPCATMDSVRAADPRAEAATAVVDQWRTVFGEQPKAVSDVITAATDLAFRPGITVGAAQGFKHPELREALLVVAGESGAINSRRLGRWLASSRGRVIKGFRIVEAGSRGGAKLWRLQPAPRPAHLSAVQGV